jgi:hypothetical protein
MEKQIMKSVAIALTLACALLISASAFSQKMDRAAAEKQIIANEQAALNAITKLDLKAFRNGLAPEAFGLSSQGLLSIADWENHFKTTKYQSLALESPQVHWVGPETAILTYHCIAKAIQEGKTKDNSAWSSSVYVLRNGKWLAIFNEDAK